MNKNNEFSIFVFESFFGSIFFIEKAANNNNEVVKLLLHHGNRKEIKSSDTDHLTFATKRLKTTTYYLACVAGGQYAGRRRVERPPARFGSVFEIPPTF